MKPRLKRGKSAVWPALIAVLCAWAGGFMAEAALLKHPQHAAWRQFWGLESTLAQVYRSAAMDAYENQKLEEAAYLLGVAADFLPGDGDILGRWGFALKQIGQYELARDALLRATAEDPDNFFHWWWLGDAQRLLGDYGAAFENFKTARDLAPDERRSELSDFADFTAGMASGAKSWQDFDRHRAFAARHEENRRYRRQMAELHMALRRAPEVREDDLENQARLAHTTNNIGTLHMHLQEYGWALPWLLEGRALYGREHFPEDVMRVTQNLALAHEWLADQELDFTDWHIERSLEYWQETLTLAKELEDADYIRYARGFFLSAWARYRPMDDPHFLQLREANKQELPWSGPINDYTVAAVCEGELYCRWQEGDYSGARILAEMMLPFLEQSTYLSDGESRVRLYLGLARGYLVQQQAKAAQDTADLALRTLQELRGYLDAEAWLRSRMPGYFEEAVALAVESRIARDATTEAVFVLEEAARRRVHDVLGPYHPENPGPGDHLTEAFLLREILPSLEALNDAAVIAPPWREKRLEEGRARLEWLENSDPFPRPSRLSLAAWPTATVAALQQNLGERDGLVYFASSRNGTIALVVGQSTIASVALAPLPPVDVSTLAKDQAALEAALDPLTEACAALDRLYLVPDRHVTGLPLEAVLLQAFGTARTLVRVPAGSTLLQRSPAAPGEERLWLDETQTETAFRNATSANGLMLFTGAMTTAQRDPMLQAMTLQSDPQHDGVVYAAELLAMALPPSLLVLAPAVWQGETQFWNPLAWQAACWHAGAASLIAPLWPVAPEAAASLAETLDAAAPDQRLMALRTWQLEAAAAGRPPTDWAGWIFFELALE